MRENCSVLKFYWFFWLSLGRWSPCRLWLIFNVLSSEGLFQWLRVSGGKALIDFAGLKSLVPESDGELWKLFRLYVALASFILFSLWTMRDQLDWLALLLAVSWKDVGSDVQGQVFFVSVRPAVPLGEH